MFLHEFLYDFPYVTTGAQGEVLDTSGEGECTQKECKCWRKPGCQTASVSTVEGYAGADTLRYFCCDITRVSN